MKYTDAYNIAVLYLAKKYGKNPCFADIPDVNHDDKVIRALVNQYYLGHSPKIELKDKLISIGLMDADLTLFFNKDSNTVRDLHRGNDIFSTVIDSDLAAIVNRETIIDSVVINAVKIWNETFNSKETLDEYLLNEENCTQDEREIIFEGIMNYLESFKM